MTTPPRKDDGWREPNDWRDFDWGDDPPDGGALVPAKPKPDTGAPAMALAVPND